MKQNRVPVKQSKFEIERKLPDTIDRIQLGGRIDKRRERKRREEKMAKIFQVHFSLTGTHIQRQVGPHLAKKRGGKLH